ncbi:uncharacterized protein EI90DRAFT_3070664 [Cantharellus anzutake]|uniref:uncharacterized protein n=1 Tax=Cantharellus anzutake TaxID=1750568 RepID=UPI00190510DD|nr:uncharacterized protein EI90DRAFT_3070664 [Cantharellus anzutake]KAF8326368.1 hypothetical protein EI90DRAFT_3070664 [Cantharellus anzutake]
MVSFDKFVSRSYPILMGSITLFTIIELAISAFLVSRYNSRHDYPSTSVRDQSRFLLFCSVWTLFSAPVYLFLFFWKPWRSVISSTISHLVWTSLSWIFWFSGAVAITASLGGGNNCSNLDYNLPYCNHLNALEGFAWIEWILFTAFFPVVIFIAQRAYRSGSPLRGGLISTRV